jgi:hypothetical protein
MVDKPFVKLNEFELMKNKLTKNKLTKNKLMKNKNMMIFISSLFSIFIL